MIYTAGDVMDDAAVLLNDAQQNLYDYTVQLPFLRMVMRDLEQQLDLNGNPINLISEAEIAVAAGITALPLPDNFFLPSKLLEKSSTDEFFTPMVEKADVGTLEVEQTDMLTYWDYRHNDINLLGSTVPKTVKLIYWRFLDEIVDEDSLSEISGARNILSHKVASKCARYVGGNKDKANDLNAEAEMSLDVLLSIGVKNNQGRRVRRKAFRVPVRYGIAVRVP